MIEKLAQVEARYNEVSEKLMQPDIVSDQKQYRDLMREHKNLTPIIEKYKERYEYEIPLD